MKMNTHTQSQMTESMLLPQLKSKKDFSIELYFQI